MILLISNALYTDLDCRTSLQPQNPWWHSSRRERQFVDARKQHQAGDRIGPAPLEQLQAYDQGHSNGPLVSYMLTVHILFPSHCCALRCQGSDGGW